MFCRKAMLPFGSHQAPLWERETLVRTNTATTYTVGLSGGHFLMSEVPLYEGYLDHKEAHPPRTYRVDSNLRTRTAPREVL